MKIKNILFFCFIFSGVFCLTGKMLDWEAERVIHQFYRRDKTGVIKGRETRYLPGVGGTSDTAVVIIHGFLDSPAVFDNLLDYFKNKKIKEDVFAPLLPFHARNLEVASQLKGKEILLFLAHYLESLSHSYQNLVLIGHSYGGLLLTVLEKEGKLPPCAHLILYAPAFYLKSNNFYGNALVFSYGLWRNYCNYKELGCAFPFYASSDAFARSKVEKSTVLPYRVMSATKEMYRLERATRPYLPHIGRKYALIVARDDNRVSYLDLKKACEGSKVGCTLYEFPSGRHMLHWSRWEKEFADLLMQLVHQTPMAPKE